MGQIDRLVECEGRLTVFACHGELAAAEIVAAHLEMIRRHATPLVLWDVTDGTIAAIPTYDLRTLLATSRKTADARGEGLTAMVLPADVDYGMGRMIEVFAEMLEYPFEIKAFRDAATAREWLGGA